MTIEVLAPILFLFLLLIMAVPVGVCLAVAGLFGLFLFGGLDTSLGILQTTPYRTVGSYALTTIPMFVLMAEFATESGITKEIFASARIWFSQLRGGLAYASVLTSAGIGAISGSSSATAAMMGSVAVPEMVSLGYNKKLALGTVSAAGTLAILIPPSIPLIIYGILAEQSIAKLLIAGVIPGIIMTLAYMLIVYFWIRGDKKLAPVAENYSFKQKVASLSGFWPMLVICAAVLGGIYSGAMTPTESAAIGALATLILAKVFWKMDWKKVYTAATRSVRTTSMIFIIIIGANIFGYFLTITRVPQDLAAFIGNLMIPAWGILAVIILLYLVLGCFMDQIAILVLTVPLTFPIVTSLGYDPIWFGVLITVLAEIGLITPPLGLNVFVASSASKIPVEVGFSGVWRFVVGSLVIMLFMILLPQIATWLPGRIH